MILDIDHIGFSTTLNLKPYIEFFKRLDYEDSFHEKNIQNLPSKKYYMKNFVLNHDLCLLNSKHYINIELIKYEKINNSKGFVTPIFNFSKKSSKKFEIKSNLNDLKIPYFHKETNENFFIFSNFLIESSDIKKSETFWRKLGFRKSNFEKNYYEFESILSSKKYQLLLKYNPQQKKHFLDDDCWNSIAFLTNSIEKEKEKFQNEYQTSEIEILEINNKKLKICFIKGPSAELIELISIN